MFHTAGPSASRSYSVQRRHGAKKRMATAMMPSAFYRPLAPWRSSDKPRSSTLTFTLTFALTFALTLPM